TSTTFQSLASASALIFLSCVSTVQRSPLRSMEARTYAATSFVFLSATSSTMQPSLRERVLQPRYVLREPADDGGERRCRRPDRQWPAAARHLPRLTRAGDRRLAPLRSPTGRRLRHHR